MSDADSHSTETTSRRRSTLVVFALVGLVLVVAIAVMVLVRSNGMGDEASDDEPASLVDGQPPIAAPEGAEVLVEQSGEGVGEIEAFDAASGWQIRWETAGEQLRIDVLTEDGEEPVLDISDGPAQGVTSPEAVGETRLRIQSDGAWRVIVVEET